MAFCCYCGKSLIELRFADEEPPPMNIPDDLNRRLRSHVSMMAPHQRDREAGRLLVELLAVVDAAPPGRRVNMDDRTPLERAAKAACYAVKPHSNNGIGRDLVFVLDGKNWNPLTDDGDALRLAVKLCLDIITRVSDRETWAQAPMVRTVIEPWAADPYAATRRAIVRAATALAQESGHD